MSYETPTVMVVYGKGGGKHGGGLVGGDDGMLVFYAMETKN